MLLISIAGTGAVVASNLRQLAWLEVRTQHTVLVPAANDAVIFTVIHSTPIPDNSRNTVNVLELSNVPPDLTAQVQLTDR